MIELQINTIDWRPCWRLVSSRFPPVCLFDRVADPEDLEVVFWIEGLTNDRLRDEVGDISLVPAEDRISGEGTTPIMAAFTHLNLEGSRFTDGRYGVYYAAKEIDTAIEETKFHRARFLHATKEPPIEIDMRSYASDLTASFHDIRNMQEDLPEIYITDPEKYGNAQAFAKSLRDNHSNGVVYSSVRKPEAECVAVFRPRLLSPVIQGAHYCFVWDGKMITTVYQKQSYQPARDE